MKSSRHKGLDLLAQQQDSLRKAATNVVNHLAVHGAKTRAELAETLGWSRTSVSRVSSLLLDAGLVVENVEPARGRGRPVARLQLDRSAGLVLGIDVGYRNLRTIVSSVDHATLAADERTLSPDFAPAEAFSAAREMLDALLRREALSWDDVVGAGLAVGAPIDEDSGSVTLGCLLPRWAGDVGRLSGEFFPCPTYVSNDARLSAYAELLWGAGRDYESFLYMKLHSGTGGCLVLNRSIVTGSNGGAGEVGHMIVEPRGRFCRCGNRGCLETIVGVPALLEALSLAYPQRLTWEQFRERLEAGDAAATRVVQHAYEVTGRVAGSIVNLFNPQAVILGGALSRARPDADQQVYDSFRPTRLPINEHVRVEIGTLGRQAAALGAVGLVLTRGIV